jgi:hypothetical protein
MALAGLQGTTGQDIISNPTCEEKPKMVPVDAAASSIVCAYADQLTKSMIPETCADG